MTLILRSLALQRNEIDIPNDITFLSSLYFALYSFETNKLFKQSVVSGW